MPRNESQIRLADAAMGGEGSACCRMLPRAAMAPPSDPHENLEQRSKILLLLVLPSSLLGSEDSDQLLRNIGQRGAFLSSASSCTQVETIM